MLMVNLKRASELINSFKQIAVDQSSEEKRSIDLKIYLHEIVLSLKPQFKRTNHNVTIECQDNLKIETYPGVLSQIVTNFIMNSLAHGFKDMNGGKIKIEAARYANFVETVYFDNGCGIKQEHLDRICEPFFTTNGADGGSGLGLNIVYNLVTQKLGGTIECISEPQRGVKFIIRFKVLG